MSKIGDYLKQYREEQHLSREQFANALFVSAEGLRKWELGIAYPTFNCLRVIHEVTGCDWEDIF